MLPCYQENCSYSYQELLREKNQKTSPTHLFALHLYFTWQSGQIRCTTCCTCKHQHPCTANLLKSTIARTILCVLIFTDKSFTFGILDKLSKTLLSNMRLSSKSFDTKIMAERMIVFNPKRKSHQNAVYKNKHLSPLFHQEKLLKSYRLCYDTNSYKSHF